ncbi:T9SS type A sorting domain-containing protein [Hymenobacter puniceus]|uniref:T9SS type A sorting domain-containing protein n=1 Tax=Hymenobacter sp. BT190 TaxID=2763505 RepID=UPI0016517587|nr:T9SS type A sorting domain-containing protein [Hymenobacter sp. BT190]MBC6700461.1 hypothetical protein [Hymenobacter sp. BT190]
MSKNYLLTLATVLLASVTINSLTAQQMTVPIKGSVTPTMMKGGVTTAAAPPTTNCFDLYPIPAITYGNPDATTTISANGGTFIFGQNAGIRGDLRLENGTFEVNPGNTLSFFTSPVNGEPTGKIIVGLGATLRINNATIRGTCNSWFGIVMEGNVSGAQLYIQNNSRISNAKYGVYAPLQPADINFDTFYYIQNSTFSNNLNHIYDYSKHISPGSSSLIEACTFTSDNMQMLPPYKYTSPTSNYITYQALFINPFTYGPGQTPPNSGSVRVNGNTIINAVYGIVNNVGDRDFVYITNNTLRSIYTLGIWTRQNQGVNVNGNSIELNASRSINTSQISPTGSSTGINYYYANASGFMNENRITGQNPADQTNYKYQTGIIADGYQSLSRNTFQQLNTGIEMGASPFAMFDNKLTDCINGVVFPTSNFSIIQRTGMAQCNTFEKLNSSLGTTYGFNAPGGNAWMPSLGQPGNPNGNRFSGIDVGVYNQGANASVNYHRLNSSQENLGTVIGASIVPENSVSPISYCLNKNAFNNNGVNAARQQSVSAAAVKMLMDSLKYERVSFVQQKEYQRVIVSYFESQSDLPGLARYAEMLRAASPESFGTIGFYLLNAYIREGNVAAAQAMRASLLRAFPREAEVRSRILLYDVLARRQNWPPAGQRLPQADSAALHAIYTSNTSVAEQAATWLRYYYPHAAPYRSQLTAHPAAATAESSMKTPLEATAYPNPATSSVQMRYTLAHTAQRVELQLTNLLTGRMVLTTDLSPKAGAHDQRIDVSHLPSGHYAYRLLVDSRVGPTQHLVVGK